MVSCFLTFAFFSYAIPSNAQLIETDTLVSELMYATNTEKIVSTYLKNVTAEDSVFYQVSSIKYDYKRAQFSDEPKRPPFVQDSLKFEAGKERSTFNKYIQHEDTVYLGNAFGNGSVSSKTVVATKYNAGASGFNLSDVGTWFIPENKIFGTINVFISAGGNSINDAEILSTGSVDYQFEKEEQNGHLFNIQLDKPVAIYPNEDFYVIFEYPNEVLRPQGCAVNESITSVAGIYFYKDENGNWADLQETTAYSKGAWLMYAAAKSSANIGWLNILGANTGIIQKGDSAKLDLRLIGNLARLGSQYADITIEFFTINDASVTETKKLPVLLRLNEAPYFFISSETIDIEEGETRSYTIKIKDFEENTFSTTPISGCKVAQFAVEDSVTVRLTVAPLFGDAGDYAMKFQAIDAHNSIRNLDIAIHVLAKNRLPVYVGVDSLIYPFMGNPVNYDINNFFTDPDDEPITFEISALNPNVIEITKGAAGIFSIRPKSVGETKLTITATDAKGGQVTHTIDVEVGLCEDPSIHLVQKWNKVLLVNNFWDNFTPDGYQWYKNGEPIRGATKQYYSSEGDTGGLLESNSEYFVKITKKDDGEIIYTCPCKPGDLAKEKNTVASKVYPNPVERNGILTIEKESVGSDPGSIQIIDILGHVRKTLRIEKGNNIVPVQMPENPGFYILKVMSGDTEETFRIKVK
jgi:hypothetical protein